MAKITIDIPDDVIQEVLNAYAFRFNYQETIYNPEYDRDLPEDENNPMSILNPESKALFAKRMLIDQVRNVYNTAKLRQAKLSIKNDLDSIS